MTRSDSVRLQGPRAGPALGSLEDRYRSLFLLGRGGMGRIEVALERGRTGATERIVALKRLLPESARDPRRKEMFLREARLGALLAHPNVVRAFAFGEIYDELFLAMEYVEGEPLSRVLTAVRDSGHTLGAALTCHVLAEVCEGLHAAHELADAQGKPLNVVHRDVSPQNVMIAYDGQVKLLDFGVAKLDSAEHQTRTGEVKGKMAYMSPEQALGDKLDRRSDLFSLGAVLFECLTGRTMWGEGTDVELMRKLALEHPPLLDSASGEIAPELAALQARLVAREPDMRPATAKDVARELRVCGVDSRTQDVKRSLVVIMGDLFGQAAADRRSLLAEALAREAPSRIEALRRTLEPGSVLRQPSVAEPVIVSSPPPRRTRRGALVASVAVATVAVSAVVAAGTRRAPAESRSAPAPAVAASIVPANATATSSAVAAASGGGPRAMVVTDPSTAPDRASRVSESKVSVRPTRPAISPAVTRPANSSSSRAIPVAPIKSHDVDPSPF